MPMVSTARLRPAVPEDCADLALLADMATRRLTTFLWGQATPPGGSACATGRSMIRNHQDYFNYVSNWSVATIDEQLAGACCGHVLPLAAPAAAVPAAVEPLNQLKALVVGSWYVSALAVYPEHQGRGLGRLLLADAARRARAAGCDRLSLVVGSFNPGAARLYRQCGFTEVATRPFVPFPGSDESGIWSLMSQSLS